MKRFYEEPSVEVTVVGTEDVVLASAEPSDTDTALFFDVNALF